VSESKHDRQWCVSIDVLQDNYGDAFGAEQGMVIRMTTPLMVKRLTPGKLFEKRRVATSL
jgi:hypothetical protein